MADEAAALPSVLCHRKGSGRDTTGRSGHHGTELDHRGLSARRADFYEGIREFDKTVDPFFKSITAHRCERPPPLEPTQTAPSDRADMPIGDQSGASLERTRRAATVRQSATPSRLLGSNQPQPTSSGNGSIPVWPIAPSLRAAGNPIPIASANHVGREKAAALRTCA